MCGSVLAELVHPDEAQLKAYRLSHPSPPPMINRIMKGVQDWTPLLLNATVFQVEWLNFERCAHAIKTFQWICEDAAALRPEPHVSFFRSVFMNRLFWKAVLSVLVKKRVVASKKATKAMAVEAGVGQKDLDLDAQDDSQEERRAGRDDQPGEETQPLGNNNGEVISESEPLKKCDVPTLAVLELLADLLKLSIDHFPSDVEDFVRLLLSARLFDRLDESIPTTAFQPGVPCLFPLLFTA